MRCTEGSTLCTRGAEEKEKTEKTRRRRGGRSLEGQGVVWGGDVESCVGNEFTRTLVDG